VARFLSDASNRVALLNSTLFILFAAATTADRWPDFAIPAAVVAFAVVAIEAVVFWRFVKERNQQHVGSLARESSPHLDNMVPTDTFLAEPKLPKPTIDIHERRLIAHLRHHRQQQHVSNVMAVWAMAHVREERYQYLNVVKEMERRRSITELDKLKVVAHSNDAFNIVAGAFEIEYFHGRTNIRVLDSSKVTVEGAARGEKIMDLLPGIQPPIYQ
jgi:hypothetical protein